VKPVITGSLPHACMRVNLEPPRRECKTKHLSPSASKATSQTVRSGRWRPH